LLARNDGHFGDAHFDDASEAAELEKLRMQMARVRSSSGPSFQRPGEHSRSAGMRRRSSATTRRRSPSPSL